MLSVMVRVSKLGGVCQTVGTVESPRDMMGLGVPAIGCIATVP